MHDHVIANTNEDELKALIHHMIHHNEHHLADTKELADKAKELGKDEAAAALEKAMELTDELAKAFEDAYKAL